MVPAASDYSAPYLRHVDKAIIRLGLRVPVAVDRGGRVNRARWWCKQGRPGSGVGISLVRSLSPPGA